jgi:tetratricopeptide (TPR) repeat protein
MKNPSKVILATAAFLTFHSMPSWSEPTLQATQSGSQEEISRLEKNIEKNYRDIKSINDLGVVQLKLGHYDEAITQFKKALEIDPLYTLGPVLSGNIYTDAENYQDKIKEFQKVIEMNREYARAHNYLGLAYLQRKSFSIAKQSLLESIKINPKYAKAHNNLGVLYEEMGETAKAIESYQVAHKVDPNDPNSLFNLGLAYDSLEDGENSVSYMTLAKKAGEKNPGQEGIDRINDKLDQLRTKYADNTETESVASLDSNVTGDAGSLALTSSNQTSTTSSPFTPLDLSQTSSSTGSSIAYKIPKALTINLKPHLDLSTLPVMPVAENHQDQVNSESISKNSVEKRQISKEDDSKVIDSLPLANELTAEPGIQESTFTDSRGTYTHPGILSESKEKVEITSSASQNVKKKMVAKKPEKKTWVSDWVFDFPK